MKNVILYHIFYDAIFNFSFPVSCYMLNQNISKHTHATSYTLTTRMYPIHPMSVCIIKWLLKRGMNNNKCDLIPPNTARIKLFSIKQRSPCLNKFAKN